MMETLSFWSGDTDSFPLGGVLIPRADRKFYTKMSVGKIMPFP